MSIDFGNSTNRAASPMAQHQMVDVQHQGMVVAGFEHPPEWHALSQINWNHENIAAPVWAYAATFNPAGAEAFEFLAAEAFYWLEPNYGLNPVGQSKYGMVCMPPMPAGEAMTRLVLPKYRPDFENLRITGSGPMPNLPQMLNDSSFMQVPTECVGIGLEYDHGGRVLEEEWYGIKTQQQASSGTSLQINWGFARLFCFRAERGHLEAARPTFWHIARSAKPNPQWLRVYNDKVLALNAQHSARNDAWRAKLKGEADFQRQLTGYYQEQRDRQNADIDAKLQSDRNRQAAPEPVLSAQERWRNELDGVTAYHDPSSYEANIIYHRSGDQVVFMNEHEEVQGSEDPTHDPTVGSTESWERLDQA